MTAEAPLVPQRILADYTRDMLARFHTDWDSLHAFQVLRWDAAARKISARLHSAIDTSIHPDAYPDMMAQMAFADHQEKPDEPPFAYLLQIEAFGVIAPLPGAPREQHEAFDAARHARTFHQHPDRREGAFAYTADVWGRVWVASKYRDAPELPVEMEFHDPDDPVRLGGSMVRMLIAVARTAGTVCYGLPAAPPPRPQAAKA